MPGHTSAISKSHPEHVACAEASPWLTYAHEPPAGQLRLASPATVNFTVGLLSAVAELFPSTLLSTGGVGGCVIPTSRAVRKGRRNDGTMLIRGPVFGG